MNINWYGENCFRIIAQPVKDSVNILIDPPSKESGLRSPKLEADVLLFTNPEAEKNVSGAYFWAGGPGEYDVKEIYMKGVPAEAKFGKAGVAPNNTIYAIEAEEIKICHLGFLGDKELSTEQLDKIGEVDILMIPVGGGKSLDAQQAVKIMSQIEPKIIIPMNYKIPQIKTELDGVDKFLKILGIKSVEALPKLSIKKKDILEEEAKVIVLQP